MTRLLISDVVQDGWVGRGRRPQHAFLNAGELAHNVGDTCAGLFSCRLSGRPRLEGRQHRHRDVVAGPEVRTHACAARRGYPEWRSARTAAAPPTARKVATGWKRTGFSKGFRCGYHPIRNKKQIETVRCVKDDVVVTFKKRWIGTIPLPTCPPIQSPGTSSN